MSFVSGPFWLLVLAVMAGLLVLPSRVARQALLLCASLIFYGYYKPSFLLVLLTPSLIDYFCALRIESAGNLRRRKAWLILSLISNLGLLSYFKYTNFLLGTAAALAGKPFTPLAIFLPAGISFYTFKTLSYVIDVYRREIPVCRSWWRYAMFVTYFPELIAGPIVRASVFLPQMRRRLAPRWSRTAQGMQLILLGLTKKLLIADTLAPFADTVFAKPEVYGGATVASGVLAYSIQIYCDFSGYSDIAIGVSRMIGFDLPENFNMPYLSTSITEFWRRWHMTLSRWLRDYLYIPLGGNRKGHIRTYVNLTLTMLLGGLWHGASWTFVAWGLLHGLGLAVHKLVSDWSALRERATGRRRVPSGYLSSAAGWVATNLFVCLGWVLFRARDFPTALTIYAKMSGLAPGGIEWFFLPLFLLLPLVILAHLFGWVAAQLPAHGRDGRRIAAPQSLAPLYANDVTHRSDPFALRPHPSAGLYVLLPSPGFTCGLILTGWILTILLFAATNTSPFIYFQF